MKILLITQFFPPETGAATKRAYEHARHWVLAGHDVTVITNVPNSPLGHVYPGYKANSPKTESINGIRIERVRTFPAGKKHGKLRRLLSAVVFLVMASIKGAQERGHDLVIGTVPYFADFPAWVTSRVHGIPFIYELRDPWIQVAFANNKLGRNSILYRILNSIQRRFALHADLIVVIGDAMASMMKKELKLDVMPMVIPNAVTREDLSYDNTTVKITQEFNGNFLVGIIGNMGSQYDLGAVVEAAKKLEQYDCEFLFLGDGAENRNVKTKVKELGLSNVIFHPPVSPSEVGKWIKRCDLTIASMKTGYPFDVYLPLKVLDSLVLETPVIVSAEGELKRLIVNSNGGGVCTSGDVKCIVQEILKRMQSEELLVREGVMGSKYVLENLTREQSAKKYITLLSKLL